MLVIISILVTLPALAQNQIEIIVGQGAGGGFDNAARILAKHLPKHISGNPTVVVKNMTGAGSVIAANHVNTVAPKDGTVIGMYTEMVMIAKLIDMPNVQFNSNDIPWLGSITSRGTTVLMVSRDGSLDKKLNVGSTGQDSTSIYARIINDMLGANLNIIPGYGGVNEIFLAIERGELDGAASAIWERELVQKKDQISSGKFKPILQLSPTKNSFLDVPWIFDMVKSTDDKRVLSLVFGPGQFFRAFSLPIGTDKKIVASFQKAFADTMNDREFIADFEKTGEPFVPATHIDMERYITEVNLSDNATIDRVRVYFK